ncbi:PREDICTED: intraflagellar transport protein 46 homolog, partial [Tinamus guttatus]|uniref:intraflagellar transport protein 46 homolog n=1 Tax=Tinamus guttatus TaxID=94827 RepID=UPI00052F3892
RALTEPRRSRAYNPADYDYLPVSGEVKELFEYIRRYTPQAIELEHKLQPFIPDFIPAVGDIDAFLKVPRPDGSPDNLGLLVLDEPSTKQSDPTVLSLWLTEDSKQHNIAQQVKVKSIENAEKNPKAIDSWIESIAELHRCKPPATVHYSRATRGSGCLLATLVSQRKLGSCFQRLPVFQLLKTTPLCWWVLFPQHFKSLAEGKAARSPPSHAASQAAEAEVLSFT